MEYDTIRALLAYLAEHQELDHATAMALLRRILAQLQADTTTSDQKDPS